MKMVTVKLVKGTSYGCPAFGALVLQRGETAEVPEDAAKVLLEDGYLDPSNNFHHYFVEVGLVEVVKPADPVEAQEAGDETKPAPKRVSRAK